MRSSWQRLSTSSGSNGLRLWSHLAAGWTSGFSRVAIRPSANARLPSSPKSMTSSQNRGTPPTRLASVLLLPLPHISWQCWRERIRAPASSGWVRGRRYLPSHGYRIGRQGWASRPSRAELHLHSLDVPTWRLDKRLRRYTLWLCPRSSRPSEEAGLDAASLGDLRSMTDLALHARHQSHHHPRDIQAIGLWMSSLIVLERHLWLTMMEIKEVDKVPFLDAPVSSGSLFGPAVEGFAERLTEGQKSSQAMRHFLPKRTSSSAASSRPRPAPTQQKAKPTPATPEPILPEGRRARGCSCSARRYPFPKHQGPQHKIVLDPAPQKSSSFLRKRRGPSLTTTEPPRKQPLMCLFATLLSAGCRGKCVFGSPRDHFSARVFRPLW